MSDRKRYAGPTSRPKSRKASTIVPKRMSLTDRKLNQIFVKSQWSLTDLSSGTTSALSFTASPSIQNSTEYSILQSLFTEVRLLRAVFKFTPVQTNSAVLHTRLALGTNGLQNGTTFTQPTSFTQINNLANSQDVFTGSKIIFHYEMSVPQTDFLSLVGDIPTIPDPERGSPGMVVGWSGAVTTATTYFNVNVIVVHQLRYRQ
jgi:hypothetical protein